MINTTTVTSVIRNMYILGEILPPNSKEIKEELVKMDNTWEYNIEEVILHINSTGGSVSTLISLQERLKKVKLLSAIAEAECMSSALYLFLLASKRACSKNTIFMLHNINIVFGSDREYNPLNLEIYANYVNGISNNLLTDYIKKPKFLTSSEIKDISNGKEIYFDAKEARNRGIVNFDINDI